MWLALALVSFVVLVWTVRPVIRDLILATICFAMVLLCALAAVLRLPLPPSIRRTAEWGSIETSRGEAKPD
jgi:hypothetical protein